MKHDTLLRQRLHAALGPLTLLVLALALAPGAEAQRGPGKGRSGQVQAAHGHGSARVVTPPTLHGGARSSAGGHLRQVERRTIPLVRRHVPVIGPQPVHVHHAGCGYVPGHHQVVRETVCIPGARRRVWVPARFETRFDPCHGWIQVQVQAGHFEWVQDPDRHELRERRVWVPATYGCGC